MLTSDALRHIPPTNEANGTFGSGVGVSLLPSIDAGSVLIERPTIAIMSFGEMGVGIAALLAKYSYPVVTNLDGRSAKTRARAESVGVKHLPLPEMLDTVSVFLSIIPPAEAFSLAQSTAAAVHSLPLRKSNLIYLDLNAISPKLSRQTSEVFNGAGVTFIDGAIIGFPPRELSDNKWFRPAITTSGPELTAFGETWTDGLASVLNIRHVSDNIGAASGLKMCFGAMYKGQAAIATQAYTTAMKLGVLPALRTHMAEYFPTTTPIIENSLVGSQRKAYRWIKEMEEIEETFAKEGGWSRELFSGVSGVFRHVAFSTNLGVEPQTDVEVVTRKICLGLKRTKSI